MKKVIDLRRHFRLIALALVIVGSTLLSMSMVGINNQRERALAVANGNTLVREELRLAGLTFNSIKTVEPAWSTDGKPIAPAGTVTTSSLLVASNSDVHQNVQAAIFHKEDYVLPIKSSSRFKGGELVFPNTREAIRRALSSVGNAKIACDDGECYNLCDHLVGWHWGYDASGYESARTHWAWAVKNGIAHAGDREPPLGALLFWDSQPNGHTAIYLGKGRVVTNFVGPAGKNVYIADADWYEKNGRGYLGWADPVFYADKPGSGL